MARDSDLKLFNANEERKRKKKKSRITKGESLSLPPSVSPTLYCSVCF